MRSVRKQSARTDKSKSSYSSLSALGSNRSNMPRQPLRSRNNRIPVSKTKDNERKEEEDYDSTDSLDQLLDNDYIPNKSKPHHMRRINESNNPRTPKKNRSMAGSKRSKAMAIMASTTKRNKKKEFREICHALKPHNNYKKSTIKSSAIKPRKIITPNPNMFITPFKKDNKYNLETPSLKSYLNTPCSPTPSKLLSKLNVETPVNNKSKTNINKSWKDMDHKAKGGNNKKNNKLSDFDNLSSLSSRLLLPIKWDILISKFSALESCLSLYQRRNVFFIKFDDVKKSVQTISKKSFSETDLKQILMVIPDFYTTQWTPFVDRVTKKTSLKLTLTATDYDPYLDEQIDDPLKSLASSGKSLNKKDKFNSDKPSKFNVESEIGIKFLKVAKLNEREKVFRLRLIQFVCINHLKFLKDNILVEFDPLNRGKWHKQFDLEHISEIELAPFPPRPVKTLNEIEKMMKEQKEKLKIIIQKEIEKNELSKNDVNKKSMIIPKHLSHLSPGLLARVRAKKMNKLSSWNEDIIDKIGNGKKKLNGGKNDQDEENQKRLQQISYLVALIRGIYISQKKRSMSLNAVINLIRKRHRNNNITNIEIKKQLEILNDLNSKFFTLKKGPVVTYAKLNKNVIVKDVLSEINKQIC